MIIINKKKNRNSLNRNSNYCQSLKYTPKIFKYPHLKNVNMFCTRNIINIILHCSTVILYYMHTKSLWRLRWLFVATNYFGSLVTSCIRRAPKRSACITIEVLQSSVKMSVVTLNDEKPNFFFLFCAQCLYIHPYRQTQVRCNKLLTKIPKTLAECSAIGTNRNIVFWVGTRA